MSDMEHKGSREDMTMVYQIIKLYENTWMIEDMGVRIFILAGRRD